ncbi:hypothetical protein M433DRAFT_468831 [Acidomyces richmondensis BFW]|nr:hypothetical protein M433DRAFT_468831 [Acidomyces richmondensis BFW]
MHELLLVLFGKGRKRIGKMGGRSTNTDDDGDGSSDRGCGGSWLGGGGRGGFFFGMPLLIVVAVEIMLRLLIFERVPFLSSSLVKSMKLRYMVLSSPATLSSVLFSLWVSYRFRLMPVTRQRGFLS